MLVNKTGLHLGSEVDQVGYRRCIAGSGYIKLVVWNHYGNQDADDCDYDHQLYEGETPDGAQTFCHKCPPAVIKRPSWIT